MASVCLFRFHPSSNPGIHKLFLSNPPLRVIPGFILRNAYVSRSRHIYSFVPDKPPVQPLFSHRMSQRRSHSTKPGHSNDAEHKPASSVNGNHVHDEHEHDHSHSHSHSLFSHSHSHDDDHNHGAEIVAALQGKGASILRYTIEKCAHYQPGDRGSQITLLGLASNVSLTIIKGLAGWFLHSASLLADAGHSMSGPSNRIAPVIVVLNASNRLAWRFRDALLLEIIAETAFRTLSLWVC